MDKPRGPLRGWLRLDATPSNLASSGAISSLVGNVESWVEWVKSAWISYVSNWMFFSG